MRLKHTHNDGPSLDGEWVLAESMSIPWECSVCGKRAPIKYDRCPGCYARMANGAASYNFEPAKSVFEYPAEDVSDAAEDIYNEHKASKGY